MKKKLSKSIIIIILAILIIFGLDFSYIELKLSNNIEKTIRENIMIYSSDQSFSAICLRPNLYDYFINNLDEFGEKYNVTLTYPKVNKLVTESDTAAITDSVQAKLTIAKVESPFSLVGLKPEKFDKGEELYKYYTHFHDLSTGFAMITSSGNQKLENEDKVLHEILMAEKTCPIIFKTNRKINNIEGIFHSNSNSSSFLKTKLALIYYFWDDNNLYEINIYISRQHLFNQWKMTTGDPILIKQSVTSDKQEYEKMIKDVYSEENKNKYVP
ncbi:MAG: hypothetical protein WCJ58_01925 [bacterium]